MNSTSYRQFEAAINNVKKEYEKLQFVLLDDSTEADQARKRGFDVTAKNSVTKCFEICFDAKKRHLKKHLQEKWDVDDFDDDSPGTIINKAAEIQAITENMESALFRYRNIRNRSVHNYSEQEAESALNVVEKFIQDMEELHAMMTKEE